MTAHGNTVLHWLPGPAEVTTPLTACGLNIDGSCDKHLAEKYPCRHGLAWTRSTDLASYQGRPYEKWPPPCRACMERAPIESA